MPDNNDNPILGPTPCTLVSRSNNARWSRDEKPYRMIASSRTLVWI